ncbi:MAG: hypothetical protein JNK87_22845, partial [Bryobacterales bacterium]|nr:hypothetical protein [Bryobacterales bacterium]
DAASLVKDLAALSPMLKSSNDQVRLQVSGLYAWLATARADSATVLAPAFPALSVLLDDTLRPVRQNGAMAIMNIRPSIPVALLPHLQKLAADTDPELRGSAFAGLVKLSAQSADALQSVLGALGADADTQRTVLRSIAAFRIAPPAVLAKVGALLRSGSPEVLPDLLIAVRALGPDAKELRNDVAAIAKSKDPDIATAARTALALIDTSPNPIPDSLTQQVTKEMLWIEPPTPLPGASMPREPHTVDLVFAEARSHHVQIQSERILEVLRSKGGNKVRAVFEVSRSPFESGIRGYRVVSVEGLTLNPAAEPMRVFQLGGDGERLPFAR